MTLITRLLLLLGVTTLSFSCKKNEDVLKPANPAADCKLKKIIISPVHGPISEYTVTYTGNNITQLLSPTDPEWGMINFTYDSMNLLKRKEIYTIGDPQLQQSSTYVNEGLIWFNRAEIDSNFYDNAYHPTGTIGYNYDVESTPGFSRGHLLTTGSNNSNVVFKHVDFTWENGDPTIVKMSVPNTNDLAIDSITYDTTKINKFNQAFPEFVLQIEDNDLLLASNYYMIYHFISRHMITKVTTTGGSYWKAIGNFTYTYNAQDFIKAIKLDGITIMQYEYTCD